MLLDILKNLFGCDEPDNTQKSFLDRIRERGGIVIDESIPAEAARRSREKHSGWI